MLEHTVVDVVREGGGGGDGQARDHREDRGEGDRGDDPHQHRAAERVGQGRCGGVRAAGQRADDVHAHHVRGGEAEHQGAQVEEADQGDRPDHRASGLLGRGHGVEAHQHMGQARRAEHERDREGDEAELGGPGLAVLVHRLEDGGAVRMGLDRLAEHRREVEAVQGEDPHGGDADGGDQQHRLDDLHPGGALHAADHHVEDHHHAHHGDHDRLAHPALDPDQQRHQSTGARHLREQVEEGDGEGRGRRSGAHGALAHAEAQHVRHRELAGVAQRLGDQQQCHQPGHQEADGVQQAVVAVQRDGADDAEERGGREVVAGDGDAVLPAGEGPTAVVEVRGGGVLLRDPDDDREGHHHEGQEDRDVQDRVAELHQ